MLRLILVTLFCLGLLQLDAVARPTHGGITTASAVCPYPVDGGCAGANQNSSFYNPSLFATTPHSGTTSLLSTHPMDYNVPGPDYPVGYDMTLTLKDPQANPPTNCVYEPLGTRLGPGILCNSTSSTTINGYNMCGTISAVGVPLTIEFGSNSLTSSTNTVNNNKLCLSTGQTSSGVTVGGGAAFVYKYNEVDGGASPLPSGFLPIVDNRAQVSTSTTDIEYNAFLGLGALRIVSSARGGGNRIFDNNYVQQLNPANDGTTHAEIDLYGGQSGAITIGMVEQNDNFINWPSFSDAGIINTATFFESTGGGFTGYAVQNTAMNRNVIVTNTKDGTPTGTHMMGQAVFLAQWASLGNVTFNDNYVDPTGATGCSANGNLTQNAVATISGNTATITSGTTAGEVGYNINGAGMAQANITNVTSNVYTFDGPTQSLGSIGIILTPGVTSLSSSGNVNLVDGSSINATAPRLFPALCTGAHN